MTHRPIKNRPSGFHRHPCRHRAGGICFTAAALTLAAGLLPADAADLIHRYPFDTDGSDVIGDAHGELLDNAVIENGAVVFDGENAYVNLPNSLLTGLSDITIEVWTTWTGSGNWQRILDFGNNTAGEDARGSGLQSIFLTPSNAEGTLELSIFTNSIDNEQTLNTSSILPGQLCHIVWTYEAASNTGKFYVNRRLVSTNTAMTHKLADLGELTNLWLGRSQYSWDSHFKGTISELRLYNGPLTGAEVEANYASGPDPEGRGDLQNLALSAYPRMTVGSTQALRAVGDFARIAGVDVTDDFGITLSSDNPAVLTINAERQLVAGDSEGGATITAALGSKTATLAIQVAKTRVAHHYAFNGTAEDTVGTANGALHGNAVITSGRVVLDGEDAYVDLPNNVFEGLRDVSLEVWTTWGGGASYQRIFDFGNSTLGENERESALASVYLTPSDGWGPVFRLQNEDGSGASLFPASLEPNRLQHIIWTYDASARTSNLYLNGEAWASSSSFSFRLADLGATVNNWLGRSQYATDPDYKGTIEDFKIHDGPLSLAEARAQYLAGPNQAERGGIVSLAMEARPVLHLGGSQQLRLVGDFENIVEVDVTSDPGVVFATDRPDLVAISQSGLLASSGVAGTATVTATLGGKSVSQTVAISLAPLLHRYTFDDNANDSEGTAHGELKGGAVIEDGSVVLDGADSYVDLPNGLVAGLTDATLEAWATWTGDGNWQRIIDFGSSSGGEDVQGSGTRAIYISPKVGDFNTLEVSIFTNGIGNEDLNFTSPMEQGIPYYIAWTYEHATRTGRLYVNGVEAHVNPAMTHTLSDLGHTTNNWLGRSQYTWDSDYIGSIDEVSIYAGPLTAEQIAANFQAKTGLPAAFNITSFTRAADSLQVTWESTAGQAYILETSTDLAGWAGYEEAGAVKEFSATAASSTATLALPPAAPSTYIRVRRIAQ